MTISGIHLAVLGALFVAFALGRGKESDGQGNGGLTELLIGIALWAVSASTSITISINFVK